MGILSLRGSISRAAATLLVAASCSLCRPEGPVPVPESWISPSLERTDIDSLAFWPSKAWVLATAKESHEILVFDGASGVLLSRHGGPGAGANRFLRPNGLAVVGDLLVVVERDNRRLQILSLPAMDSLGTFGESVLRRPYGIAVTEPGSGDPLVFVTDNYLTEDGSIPPEADLGERVKCFRLVDDRGLPRLEHLRSFGETEGPGILRKVESIAVDLELDRVLVAEEDERFLHLAVYSLDGRFTGRIVGQGTFGVEPEGLALLAEHQGGLWVATDQNKSRTIFHLFSREGLEPMGSFRGVITANTDGICVAARPLANFPRGAVFAVHDDSAVSAFSWDRILRGIRPAR